MASKDGQTAKARSGHRVQSLPQDMAAASESKVSVSRQWFYPVNSVESNRVSRGVCGRPNAEKTRTKKDKSEMKMLRTDSPHDLSSEKLIELVGNRFEHILTRTQSSGHAVFSTIQ